MLKKTFNLTKIGLLGFILLFSAAAQAQFLPQSVSLSAAPSSPSPGESITVRASTPLFDRNTAFFSWSVDGAPRPEFDGLGKNTITLTAGSVGSVTRVSVSIRRLEGNGGEGSFVIRVSDLALTYFADTYTPRWYKGKALPVQNSVVNVAAVPHIILDGERIRSENLIYRWTLDEQKNVLSGVGEDIFKVRLSPYTRNPVTVKVAIEDIEKRIRKEGSIFIEPREPRAGIYPFSPLGGIEPRNGTGFFFTPKRGLLDFMAEVFFLPINTRKELGYVWRVDGLKTEGAPNNPYLLTVDTGTRPSGSVSLGFSADSKNDLAPSVSKTLKLLLQ